MGYKITSPMPIAEGGTNAVTMATTDGVVYYDGTRLVTTAVGTATHVLTSNGAGVAPTFQPAGGGSGDLVLIQTRTATAQASLTFTTGITNTYNNYLLVAGNITSASATNASKVLVQLSNDGGATYDSTNYLDFGAFAESGLILAQAPAGTDWSVAATIATASMPMNNLTSGAGNVISLTNTYSVSVSAGTFIGNSSFSGGIFYSVANQTINAFKIVMSDAANFTGTFSLYGYVV